jgi:hypothetical protein
MSSHTETSHREHLDLHGSVQISVSNVGLVDPRSTVSGVHLGSAVKVVACANFVIRSRVSFNIDSPFWFTIVVMSSLCNRRYCSVLECNYVMIHVA